MTFSDLYSGSALSGGSSGAMSGGMATGGNPYGFLIGGGLGLLGGAQANSERDKATAEQKKGLAQIMAQMRALSSESYDSYMNGIKQAMTYFGPAQQAWNRAYGSGGAMPNSYGAWAGTGLK